MDIKTFGKITNLSKDTIHYYIKLNLINPVKNGYYYSFSDEDVNHCNFIFQLKQLDMTLKQIKGLFELNNQIFDFNNLSSVDLEKLMSLRDFINTLYQKTIKKEERLKQTKTRLNKMLDKLNGVLMV